MALNSEFTPEGAVKPSSLEVSIYEQQMLASRTMPLPHTQQIMIDYVGGTNPIYVGIAPQGFSTTSGTNNNPAAPNWMIRQITWDGNNNPTQVLTAWGSWQNRSSLTYS